jgi:hypothetical protein
MIVSGMAVMAQAAYADDVGTVDFSYSGVTAPTGDKPQSKLWIADGIWWGSLWDTGSQDYHIFRFDWQADRWTDTGVLIDERATSYMDTLWDGTHLYVATAGRGASGSNSPRIVRFSYNAGVWTRDPGFPVTVGTGGAEAVVVAKDSTGLLWLTYTQGSRVWLTHSVAGNDAAWVPRYQLPTPGNEANVSSDDISAIVAYDGDKIGVLWSNQVTMIMFWSWHLDGQDDRVWTLQVAYQQPEGADDHISLRSLVGDSSGRVFAAVKTSMDHPQDPLINVLVLTPGGQWQSHVFSTQADDHTRAILMIDQEHRELYVFAAAPCCSGGPIYYKMAPLDNINFAPGLGQLFISNAVHSGTNNVTSTKQNVDSTVGLLVEAGDDHTRYYLHNKLDLGGTPADPPETTITLTPPSPTTSSDATFEFVSDEPGSTFLCQLDGGPEESCASPKQYTGLAEGSHTFAVTAVDAEGLRDPSPAGFTWRVDTIAPETTITAGPPVSSTSTSASFSFSADEPGSTFRCRLDALAAAACTSPTTYSGLAEGSHSFEVAATDAAGNVDATPATWTWTVEPGSTPPPAITRVAATTTVNTTATNTVSVATPTGAAAGDVLVACLALNGGAVAATGVPAGWSPIAAVTGVANPHVFGYYRLATDSEPAEHRWTLTSSVANGAGIARYTGAAGLDAAASTASGAAGTSGTVAGVTTVTANAMLVGCMAINSSSTATTIASPAGMAQAWDIGGKRQELADGVQADAGASGPKTWTFSSIREWAGWLVALRPALTP